MTSVPTMAQTALPCGLVSIGYEGRSAPELVQELISLSVEVLIDVRLTPLSRKPGLSKKGLQAALEEVGIEYRHLRNLGNPKDNRDGFRLGQASSREKFRGLLRTPEAVPEIAEVASLLATKTVALLCFERQHLTCHRHVVVDELLIGAPGTSVVQA